MAKELKPPSGEAPPGKKDEEDMGEDEPLDLTGYETMQQSFGRGSNGRRVLVGKPITLRQLVALSR